MSTGSEPPADDTAEAAFVGDAGEPQRADQPGVARTEQAPPTPEELDAREERLAAPRKPMGPVQSATPETVPDEQ